MKRTWVVESDYAQLELRIVAQLANDEPLLQTFRNKEDPHAKNAADIFGIPIDQITKAQRDFAKVFVYAANYLGTAETIWAAITVAFPDAGFTLLQIDRLIKNWFRKHPAIHRWHQTLLGFVRKHDYVEAPLSGHRNYFYGLYEPNKIVNYPVQHTAGDIINSITPAVDAQIDWPREGILFQCHDALICDGPDPWRLVDLLESTMSTTVTIGGVEMHYPVDCKIGRDWGHCVEVKADTNRKKLERQLLREERQRQLKRRAV